MIRQFFTAKATCNWNDQFVSGPNCHIENISSVVRFIELHVPINKDNLLLFSDTGFEDNANICYVRRSASLTYIYSYLHKDVIKVTELLTTQRKHC